MLKVKVYKVTPEEKRSLEYQFKVAEVRPGLPMWQPAVDYILAHVAHKDTDEGVSPIADSSGVHLTKWLILDDRDIYWFIPEGRFRKEPTPIEVRSE